MKRIHFEDATTLTLGNFKKREKQIVKNVEKNKISLFIVQLFIFTTLWLFFLCANVFTWSFKFEPFSPGKD